MAKSASVARSIEDYYRGTVMPTPPVSMWLGLLDGDGDEAAYPGYVRQEVDADEDTFGPNGTPLSNQISIPFAGPTSGGPHPQLIRGRIFKASTGSAYWFDGVLNEPKTPVNDQDFVVPIGDITHTELPAP